MCKKDRQKVFSKLDKQTPRFKKGIKPLTAAQEYGSNCHLQRIETAITAKENVSIACKPYVEKHPHLRKILDELGDVHAFWIASNKNWDRFLLVLEDVGLTWVHDFVPSYSNVVGMFKPKKGTMKPNMVT